METTKLAKKNDTLKALELALGQKAVKLQNMAEDNQREKVRVLSSAQKLESIRKDIHDRVNYATKRSKLKIDKKKKTVTLVLKIDTNFVPVIEYFEIFTERMIYCRKAANFLGYKFGLVINNFKLL